jgi:GTP-binding protein
MFIDRAEIYVRSGKGGDGCISFRREKYVPKGGPDGGDGGRGGSVVIIAQQGVDTLLPLAGKHHWTAEDGRPGGPANCHGGDGQDLIIPVPPGTLIYDRERGYLLRDLATVGDRLVVAKGGRGGRGNKAFASPTHQTPREAEPGKPAVERWLRLELKLIADAGLVGLPNAGKSTLLSRLSRARPKIAEYPFTTRTPQLGLVELSDFRQFVLADIPGLIEGAHQGAGLGDEFLRHIERTRVIVHLIDICPGPGQPTPAEAYHVVRREMQAYSPALADKPEIIVANKMDLTGSSEALEELRDTLGQEVIGISAVTGEKLAPLSERLWSMISEARRQGSPGVLRA